MTYDPHRRMLGAQWKNPATQPFVWVASRTEFASSLNRCRTRTTSSAGGMRRLSCRTDGQSVHDGTSLQKKNQNFGHCRRNGSPGASKRQWPVKEHAGTLGVGKRWLVTPKCQAPFEPFRFLIPDPVFLARYSVKLSMTGLTCE